MSFGKQKTPHYGGDTGDVRNIFTILNRLVICCPSIEIIGFVLAPYNYKYISYITEYTTYRSLSFGKQKTPHYGGDTGDVRNIFIIIGCEHKADYLDARAADYQTIQYCKYPGLDL
uniref:Uncharacterized protein n=1 Tax=Serratia marcescens TaxID=615 RepID=A0A9X8VJN3_SERMA